MPKITIRPYYGRASSMRLWAVYVDGIAVVVTTTYPSYLVQP